MNKIVREHYPAAKLPDDLREGLLTTDMVTVVIEPEHDRPQRTTRDVINELLKHRNGLGPSPKDAVERVSSLRDEWDAPQVE